MIKFKMFCPDCRAVVITMAPQSVILELCPGCRSHIWDLSDALMADIVPQDQCNAGSPIIHPDN